MGSQSTWQGIAKNLEKAVNEANEDREPRKRVFRAEDQWVTRLAEWRRTDATGRPRNRVVDMWEAAAICALIQRWRNVRMQPLELSDLPFERFRHLFILRARGGEAPPEFFDALRFLRDKALEHGRLKIDAVTYPSAKPPPSERLRMYPVNSNMAGMIRPIVRDLIPKARIGVRFKQLSQIVEEANFAIGAGNAPFFYALTLLERAFMAHDRTWSGFWMTPGPLRPEPRLSLTDLDDALVIGTPENPLEVPEFSGYEGLVCGIVTERPLLRSGEVESALIEPFVSIEQLETITMRLKGGHEVGHWSVGVMEFRITSCP